VCITVPPQSEPLRIVNVKPENVGAIIRMKLPAGPRHIRAQFSTADGSFFSSVYYLYVRLVK